MKTVNLNLKKQLDLSYEILINKGAFETIPDTISQNQNLKERKILILTDSNVFPLYGKSLLQNLQNKGLDTWIFYFEAGEKQKNINTKIKIESFMFENKFTRDSFIIALGGGVVGDLGGFTAATFNRGIPFIQVPTSLLAQIDSSIGGKTGIDTKYGKNLIGAFHQPLFVIIDPNTLDSLPDKDFRAGMAEVVKHAIIKDKNLFMLIENNKDKILAKNKDILSCLIERNCIIKRDVVQLDEKEGNIRKILNFGHTIGHAIESIMDYRMLHGECVAIGMVVESLISYKLGFLKNKDKDLERIKKLLKTFGLPISIPNNLLPDDILKATFIDKKAFKNKVHYSLPSNIGSMACLDTGLFSLSVCDDIVLESIKESY